MRPKSPNVKKCWTHYTIHDDLNRELFLNHEDREERMYENLSALMTFAVFEVFAVFVHHLCRYV